MRKWLLKSDNYIKCHKKTFLLLIYYDINQYYQTTFLHELLID